MAEELKFAKKPTAPIDPPKRCADATIDVPNTVVGNDPGKVAFEFKKQHSRQATFEMHGQGWDADIWEYCIPCLQEGEMEAASALKAAMMLEKLICCMPVQLEPENCKGTFNPSRRRHRIYHPLVQGATSKFGKACMDIAPMYGDEFIEKLGSVAALYGQGSMPFIDADIGLGPKGYETMLRILYTLRNSFAMAAGIDPDTL